MTLLSNAGYSAIEVYFALPTIDLEPIFNIFLLFQFLKRNLFHC